MDQIGEQPTADFAEEAMLRRAITLGEGGSATASFHRCAAIRESQRRHRANYFVDGATENLTTTDLSRISGSFVTNNVIAAEYTQAIHFSNAR